MNHGKRVAVIGAGNVGASIAYSLAMRGSAKDVLLYDTQMDMVRGKALDISQACATSNSHTVVMPAQSMADLVDCDVVVVTAGSPRLPGMSRDDLLMKNANITREVINGIAKYSPNSIIIMVSNPLDAMTYVALKDSGFDKSRVLGMAGILDSSRMAAFIQEKLGYGGGQIRTCVLGGHGDDMLAIPRYCTVAGVPLSDLLTKEEINEIVQRTKNGGAEIVSHLKTGSAYYAPAKSTTLMVEAILNDSKQVYPCAVYLDGEYGYKDVVLGVPIVLGANGAEKIIEITLNDEEKEMLNQSRSSVQSLIDTLNNNNFLKGK